MKAQGMAGHLIRRLHQISTSVFANHMQNSGYDLTPVQFAALDAIIANPDQDQASIAAQIAYDRATIGGVIDRLVQKNLVARTVAKHDRRARQLRATELGIQTYIQILPIVAGLQSDVLFGLSQTERDQFLSLARKVIDATNPDQ